MSLLKDNIPALKYGAKIMSSEVLNGGDDFASIWYVDGDNGSDDDTGNSPDTAFAKIQTAIDAASSRDIIYIRAIDPDADASEPGTYEEDLTIAYAKWGLQLIGMSGTGILQPFGGPKIKNATATALLTVNAPYCQIKGLQFNCTRNSGTYGIYLSGVSGYATLAGSCGAVIQDCYFKNAAEATAAIYTVGGYASLISRCTFQMSETSIIIGTTSLSSNGHTIEHCNFKSNNGAAIAEHITIASGQHVDISITDSTFDVATSFISCGSASNEGIIARCQFNDLVATLANATGKIKIPSASMACVGCTGGVGLDVIQSQT